MIAANGEGSQAANNDSCPWISVIRGIGSPFDTVSTRRSFLLKTRPAVGQTVMALENPGKVGI